MDKQNRRFLNIVLLTVFYVFSGKLGLKLAFLHPRATALWANSGIALAALLILGTYVWPGILLGTFLINVTTAGSVATSIGIAIGTTLEALVGAWLVRRFSSGKDSVFRARDFLKFTILAGMFSTALAATIGVTSLALGGFTAWKDYWPVWLTWWLADAAGDLIVAPVFLLWASGRGRKWKWSLRLEAVVLLALVVLASQAVFNGILVGGKNYPLDYLCMPFLAWAAFRFGQREASVTMLVFAGSAIWGTLSGFGPFGGESTNESLLLLQAFLVVSSVMTVLLSAEIAEHRRAEAEARSLAIIDALTGLGNHRMIIDALDAEIRRCTRSEKSFSFLMLDLDCLKNINDVYGHLTGNRAICRLANVLRVHCRDCDIVGRYGGDEFAVILPEAKRQMAYRVANRIQMELTAESEHPPLSVSVGVAVWPADGTTVEKLLWTADQGLYEMKKRGRGAISDPARL